MVNWIKNVFGTVGSTLRKNCRISWMILDVLDLLELANRHRHPETTTAVPGLIRRQDRGRQVSCSSLQQTRESAMVVARISPAKVSTGHQPCHIASPPYPTLHGVAICQCNPQVTAKVWLFRWTCSKCLWSDDDSPLGTAVGSTRTSDIPVQDDFPATTTWVPSFEIMEDHERWAWWKMVAIWNPQTQLPPHCYSMLRVWVRNSPVEGNLKDLTVNV